MSCLREMTLETDNQRQEEQLMMFGTRELSHRRKLIPFVSFSNASDQRTKINGFDN